MIRAAVYYRENLFFCEPGGSSGNYRLVRTCLKELIFETGEKNP